MGKMFRRIVLSVLSFAMVLTQLNVVRPVYADGIGSGTGRNDITLVWDAYQDQMTNDEKEVSYIVGLAQNYINYVVPTVDDDLVTVYDKATEPYVEVKDFTDEHGNTWVPEEVYLVVNGVKTLLTSETSEYKYNTDSNNYSFEVVYRTYASMDKATQVEYLNIPFYLKNIVSAFDDVYSTDGNLKLIAENIDALMMFVNGLSVSLGGATMTQKLDPTSDANVIAAINALKNQTVTNKSEQFNNENMFNLNITNNLYSQYQTKKADFLNAGDSYFMKEHAVATIGYLKAIYDSYTSGGINTLKGFAQTFVNYDPVANADIATKLNQLNSAMSVIKSVIDKLDKALSYNAEADKYECTKWVALDKYEEGLFNTGWLKDSSLNDLLKGAIKEYTTSDSFLKDKLLLEETKIQQSVNQYVVKVVYNAEGYKGKDKVELESFSKQLTLNAGMSKADVLAEINAIDFMSSAPGEWLEFNIDSEHYNVTDDANKLPDTLDRDLTFEINFTPKEYEVKYVGTLTDTVKAHYLETITLPNSTNPNKTNFFELAGQTYTQGDVYKVEGPVTFTVSAVTPTPDDPEQQG